jgi:Smr domain
MPAEVPVDLHGYHPDDICGSPLRQMIKQAWEMGAGSIRFIHGHGHNRGISPGFVNTNTGYFGLQIRRELRHYASLRQWIKHTTLDCSHDGSTAVKLKRNPSPTRTDFDGVFPESRFRNS